MTPQEMIDVITAFRDGKPVETNDGGSDWWPVLSPQFNFHRYIYRVKPPALRPHWPALLTIGVDSHIITDRLYPSLEDAKTDCASDVTGVRLVTEYPPVMLP